MIMNGWNQKQFLHHWRKKHFGVWQLLLLFGLFLGLSVFALRNNNLKMVELRNQVVQADAQNKDLAGAIERLNYHVFHHMNTQIVRPVELVNTYNLQARAVIEASSRGSGRDIYAEATAACERRGIPLTSIAQCAADFAAANNPGVGPKAIKLPDKNRFIYTFASPRWTPDLAGLSLLGATVTLIWLTARLGEYILVRLIIRHRIKNNF